MPQNMSTVISNSIEATFKSREDKIAGGNNDHIDIPTKTPDPSLGFIKTTDKGSGHKLKASDTITYTFEVETTGNATLSKLAIDDELQRLSKVKLTKTMLAPSEKTAATSTYTVMQAEVDKANVQNTATITANLPQGDPIKKSLSHEGLF